MNFTAKKSEIFLTHLKVLHVVDGDGFFVTDATNKKQEEIRLLGIDAPEIRRCKKLLQDERETHIAGQLLMELGRQSLHYLIKLAPVGMSVTLRTESTNTTDLYGRILAYAYLPDGSCINERMIAEGFAKPFNKYFCSALPHYQKVNTFAKSQRKGLYSVVKNF